MNDRAVILMNLGSPDSTEASDVRRYLREFLSDKRVIDTNPFIRWMVLNFIILPRRPRITSEAYAKIWRIDGSPLISSSFRLRDCLRKETTVAIEIAMRYGRPSIKDAIGKVFRNGVQELFLAPLYPHYAMSSYETVVVRVMDEVQRQCPTISTTLLEPFFDDPEYISALAENSSPYLDRDHDLLLFSFHGIPERHLQKSDPSHHHCLSNEDCCTMKHPAHATCYRHQCMETAHRFAQQTNTPPNRYAISFQSRLGRDPWLRPYTDHELVRFAAEGIRKILVICPSFVTDCLETLEEIEIRGRETFVAAGGESLTLIPCLNHHSSWIRFLTGKINRWIARADSDQTPSIPK